MAEYMEYDWRAQAASFRSVNDEYIRDSNNYCMKKSDKSITDAINALRRLAASQISTETHLRSAAAAETDQSLRRFACAAKCNIDKAWKLLVNYERHKETLREMSGDDEEEIRSAFLDGLPGVLRDRDRRGRKVIIMNAFSWDGTRYSIMTVYKALILSLEKLSYDEQNQENGFVLIIDWTGFSLRLSTQLGPRILRLMAVGLHDCFPVKFKGVHFVNRPLHVAAALLSVRSILNDKAKRRLFHHGNNLSTLHEHVAKDILPTELGGEQGSYNPTVWMKEFQQTE